MTEKLLFFQRGCVLTRMLDEHTPETELLAWLLVKYFYYVVVIYKLNRCNVVDEMKNIVY